MTGFDPVTDDYERMVAESISFGGKEHEYYTRRKVDHLVDLTARLLGDARRVRALDVGCGIGLTDELLAPRVGELHGTDVAATALERAARINPGVTYQAYDGSTLPHREETFDLVFAICVLHHVDPTARDAFVAELRRVTRPGGIVAIFEHNPLNPLTRFAVSRCEFDEDAVLLSRRETTRRLQDAGLAPAERRYITLLPFERRWVPRVERSVGWIPLGAQYYVAARR